MSSKSIGDISSVNLSMLQAITMMHSAKYYKMFLVGSNVILLLVGLFVLILSVKMKWALSLLLLINVPMVLEVVNAVIATGFLISAAGIAGISGACAESRLLLLGHLVLLGVIVIMEFTLGLTLMKVRDTISMSLHSPDCNNVCAASIDAAFLDYALPSAGLMMSVIFVEALMIYCSINLYFYVNEHSKEVALNSEPVLVIRNSWMQNGDVSTHVTTPQPQYTSLFKYSPRLNSDHHMPGGQSTTPRRRSAIEDKLPDYGSLPILYLDASVVSDDTEPFVINNQAFNLV